MGKADDLFPHILFLYIIDLFEYSKKKEKIILYLYKKIFLKKLSEKACQNIDKVPFKCYYKKKPRGGKAMKKNYKRRRIFAFCIILVLSVTGVSGCGSNAKEEEILEMVELTDTIRWFNASYAILTETNNWDYNLFGGLQKTESNQKTVLRLLDEWWGVTDWDSADSTLQWIKEKGHRSDFARIVRSLEKDGMSDLPEEEREAFLLEHYDIGGEDRAHLYVGWYKMYEEYGIDAITGWDCCRAMNLLGYYYIAGYYSQEEALDISLEIAQTIQPLFNSWDDLMDSYLRGYEYWSEESSSARKALYEKIKTRDDNPYQVDFHIKLEKTW